MSNLVPPAFMESLVRDMFDRMNAADRHVIEMSGEDPDNLPTRYVEQPLPRDFLRARKAWIKQWQAMVEEGTSLGYLDREACYECAGELVPTTETTEYKAEPNPDYDPAKPLPPLAQHIHGGGTIKYTYETWKPLDLGHARSNERSADE